MRFALYACAVCFDGAARGPGRDSRKAFVSLAVLDRLRGTSVARVMGRALSARSSANERRHQRALLADRRDRLIVGGGHGAP
jgi:hypothetical protein